MKSAAFQSAFNQFVQIFAQVQSFLSANGFNTGHMSNAQATQAAQAVANFLGKLGGTVIFNGQASVK